MEIEDDPRFRAAIEQFNAGEVEEAGEVFEELYFEAVRDEVDFVRVFLQIAVGLHHVERNQRRAAVERLEEGLRVIERVTNHRGFDLRKLANDVRAVLPAIARGEPFERVRVQ